MISSDRIEGKLNRGPSSNKNTELAPEGYYRMQVRGVYAAPTQTGTPSARIFLVHTEDNNYQPANLRIFKSKEDGTTLTGAAEDALIVIGNAAGLSNEEIQTMDFSVSGDEAVITANGIPLAFGKDAPDVFVSAKIVQETGKDGKVRNVVKSLSKSLS